MEALLLLAVVVIVGILGIRWMLRAAAALTPPTAQDSTQAAAQRTTIAPTPRPRRLTGSTAVPTEIDPALVADLRELPSTRYRIKGSAFVVSDANRERFGGTEYQLRREPQNRHDAHAIAIYGQGHKVGYISAAKAASLAPLLDELPEAAFTVSGAGVVGNSIRLWVDVPSIPALREHVKERTRAR